LAEDVNYNSGFGGQEIAKDLVVVGTGWWMERHEYDGSEWWEFKAPPVRMIDSKPFSLLAIPGKRWKTLARINGKDPDEDDE